MKKSKLMIEAEKRSGEYDKKSKRTFILSAVTTLLVLTGLGVYVTLAIAKSITSFYDSNTLVFQKPLTVTTQKPVVVQKKVIEEKIVYADQEELTALIKSTGDKSEIAEYICEVFGVTQCATAIAVAKAESGMREEAFGINTNATIDVGIFQINSIHFTKEGCSLKEVSTWKGNIDCAVKIQKASGWEAWVAYTRDRHLPFL